MDKMKAFVFHGIGQLELTEIPIPHVKDPDDVLLKVKAVGICGSDVKILEGKHHFKPNTVLGHEFCGEVVEVGDIRLDDVREPTIQDPNDAIVRITASAICGVLLVSLRWARTTCSSPACTSSESSRPESGFDR